MRMNDKMEESDIIIVFDSPPPCVEGGVTLRATKIKNKKKHQELKIIKPLNSSWFLVNNVKISKTTSDWLKRTLISKRGCLKGNNITVLTTYLLNYCRVFESMTYSL